MVDEVESLSDIRNDLIEEERQSNSRQRQGCGVRGVQDQLISYRKEGSKTNGNKRVYHYSGKETATAYHCGTKCHSWRKREELEASYNRDLGYVGEKVQAGRHLRWFDEMCVKLKKVFPRVYKEELR